MAFETVLALFVFGLVASITPGPNNVMLLASGTNFGFRRTIPHMAGIVGGFALLLLAVGLGLGVVISTYPAFHTALKLAGSAYLLYLAYKIATAPVEGRRQADAVGRPLTFLQAALFQWVNPKAWVTAISAMALYASPTDPAVTVALTTGGMSVAAVFSVMSWAGFGVVLRRFLDDPRRLRLFNYAMGACLALTLIPLLA